MLNNQMRTLRIPGLLSALTLTTLTGLALTAKPAQAQVVQYSSQSSFDSATTGLTTFTFNGQAPTKNNTNYPTGLTVDGVTFTGDNGFLYVDDPSDGNGDPFGGEQYLDSDDHQALHVALPAGITAFGADFSNYSVSSSAPIIALVNGQTFTFTEPSGTSNAFEGFISSAPITSLSFSLDFNNADYSASDRGPAIDNVSFGTTPAAITTTPEPASYAVFALGGIGLLGLGMKARKRRA